MQQISENLIADICCAPNGRYLKLLRDAFNGAGSGRGLHFSFDVDVTQTQQRAAKLAADAGAAAKPLHATAESRFFWNQKLLQPLLGTGAYWRFVKSSRLCVEMRQGWNTHCWPG